MMPKTEQCGKTKQIVNAYVVCTLLEKHKGNHRGFTKDADGKRPIEWGVNTPNPPNLTKAQQKKIPARPTAGQASAHMAEAKQQDKEAEVESKKEIKTEVEGSGEIQEAEGAEKQEPGSKDADPQPEQEKETP